MTSTLNDVEVHQACVTTPVFTPTTLHSTALQAPHTSTSLHVTIPSHSTSHFHIAPRLHIHFQALPPLTPFILKPPSTSHLLYLFKPSPPFHLSLPTSHLHP
ncbi:hypothetical protein Pmani_025616 [Petrolisthes manimaculis]|uniref:Uncharacterized protein n=1 Tax=Petrolisthes manimaculis TaxID=1843537 RepID=A0AAE1P7S5_9EUCA|nr:hypothetical protein Pmani_025616 [Petrolisthes manimaculis]